MADETNSRVGEKAEILNGDLTGDSKNDPAADSGAVADETSSGDEYLRSPAKLMRIGSMIKQVLEEVHKSELDEASRGQLRDIYQNALDELDAALGEELGEELERISIDFGDDVPSEAQLRVAKAQLIGWMEGVFHGIQAALIAQQNDARQQLAGMRAEIEKGPASHSGGPGYL